MKTIDIFCASQAAITTMNSDIIDHHHPSSSNGGRAIDRHNPIIQDEKRLTKTLPPIPPNSNTQNNKNKNKSRKLDQKSKNIAFADENSDQQQVTMNKNNYVVKKQGSVLLGWGCTRPGDFISPATSSRFLLADKALSDDQFDPLLKQVSSSPAALPPPPLPEKIDIYDGGDKSFRKKDDDGNPTSSSPVKSLPRSSSSRSSDQQVVVLRVSLHCKGCEKKMRKHISKMEGVTSFNIDFMAKKVTVVGDITPLAVLASVSKVKNAKLLTPTTISSSTVPHMDSSFSEIKKQLGLIVA